MANYIRNTLRVLEGDPKEVFDAVPTEESVIGCNGLQEAKEMATRKGLDDVITWQDFYTGEELAQVYQRSIIPFTAGSARHPLTCAMVNATPVIATRAVDIPEYLADLEIY